MTKRVLVLLWTEAEWTKALEWPETCRGLGTAMGVGEVVPQDDLAGDFDATHEGPAGGYSTGTAEHLDARAIPICRRRGVATKVF
jgi:hypothetical protein